MTEQKDYQALAPKELAPRLVEFALDRGDLGKAEILSIHRPVVRSAAG
jgi:hypothetical protein